MSEDIHDFVNSFSDGDFPGVLGEIYREAALEGMPVIPPETAAFFRTLLTLLKPRRILEIGCAVGFSTGLFAGLLADGGKIVTIDRYPYMINIAKQNFKRLEIEDKVTLMEGDAAGILPSLDSYEKFDFIFLDAAKAQYVNFLPRCIELLADGGALCADDVFLSGLVSKERLQVPRRQRTAHKRMNEFLNLITNDARLATSILPIGDGLSFSVKK